MVIITEPAHSEERGKTLSCLQVIMYLSTEHTE